MLGMNWLDSKTVVPYGYPGFEPFSPPYIFHKLL